MALPCRTLCAPGFHSPSYCPSLVLETGLFAVTPSVFSSSKSSHRKLPSFSNYSYSQNKSQLYSELLWLTLTLAFSLYRVLPLKSLLSGALFYGLGSYSSVYNCFPHRYTPKPKDNQSSLREQVCIRHSMSMPILPWLLSKRSVFCLSWCLSSSILLF